MSYWIDSHSHLNGAEFRDEFAQMIQNCQKANVGKVMLICMNKEDLEFSLEKKKEYPMLDIAFGYHPEDVEKISQSDLDYLAAMINDERILAIGEIGLDYHWDKSQAEKQKELFIYQLQLANQVHKPVIIHTRDASQDTFDILKEYAHSGVLMHCFGESYEMMKEYEKLDYYFSFTGVLTFKNSKTAVKNASEIPLDRLMVETDCPYMTPVPLRGQRNESSYVHYTGEFLAQLRNLSNEALQKQLMENYERFFYHG